MTNPPSYTHRVLFRPLDFYFFGGELTFGNGGEVNYFAKTQPYPQQTTLLGVLRHLGFRAGLGIGKSFDHESTSTYGFIEGLSPLFMVRDDEEFAFGPFLAEAYADASLQPEGSSARQWLDGAWRAQPVLPTLNPKEHYLKKSLVSTKTIEPEDWDNFAITSQRIGIIKTTDAQDKQDGFYKQEVGHLKKGVTFACLANFSDEVKSVPTASVLGVGGEKARFAVTIEEVDKEEIFTDRFPKALFEKVASPDYATAVLLSDAYVDRHLYEQLPFVVAETRDFRYLSTPNPTKVSSWGRFQRHGEKAKGAVIKQSRKLNLLSRGSVLYAAEPKTLDNLLRDSRWQAIGYNHYHSFAKTSA